MLMAKWVIGINSGSTDFETPASVVYVYVQLHVYMHVLTNLTVSDPGFPTQYIQQNIRSDCSNIDKILEPPEGQDEGVWKYEHLR